MNYRAWLACVALVLAASVLLGEQAIVKTRDGQTLQGDMRETLDSVVLNIRGIETTIPKADIVSIEKTGDYAAQFQARLARLEPRDTAGRIAMAREAFGQGRYELARLATESALANDPNSREASDMLEYIQSQIRLERTRVETAAPRPAVPAPTTVHVVDRRLLTPADVEAIRRRELHAGEANVRLQFDRDVKKRFADSQNMPYPEFNALPPTDQALAIIGSGNDEMRSHVRVLSDPMSMIEFRRQIQPLIVQNCATIGCHGAAAAGGFMLFNPADNEAVAYTNFYILQSFVRMNTGGGVFGSGEVRMIDRGKGNRSLLANFGLPATIGEFDHPAVNGRTIQPIFRNREDLRYRMVVEWMDRALVPTVRDYGIRYTPPLPTTMPAQQ